jgi:feruloyl esterase
MYRAVVGILLSAVSILAVPCENLSSLVIPHASITFAQTVAAGQFLPPAAAPGGSAAFKNLPAFCRIAATLRPVADSEIKIEVWMPGSAWNGKLQSVGNGAWAGSISYPALAAALASGYAAASTDTGHTGNNPKFASGHPEKVVDFAYRAVHEMTGAAKVLLAAFYAENPTRAYFNGCSTGGRQALAEAQRFPNDYDGIIAGAPANYVTRLQGAQVWTAQMAHQEEAGYIPPAKYPLIHNAVLQACDALDGLKDGVLEDPTRCRFDPEVLACKEGDGPDCLTRAQVQAAQRFYAGPSSPRSGQNLFPGLERGSELGWTTLAGPRPMALAVEVFQYLVFQNPSWDYLKFDVDADIATAEKTVGPVMNSVDPNLKPLFDRGGKLLLYHGWADPGIPPRSTVNYYVSVVDTLGGASKVKDSIRLFMVPGMGHCRGGDGTDTFDPVTALDRWVTAGEAPNRIEAAHLTKGVADKTRPLCPYPEVAVYKGSGSTTEAASFACRKP